MIYFCKYFIHCYLLFWFFSYNVLANFYPYGATATIRANNNGKFVLGQSGQLTCFGRVNSNTLPFAGALLVKRILHRNYVICSVVFNETLRFKSGAKLLNLNVSLWSTHPTFLPMKHNTNMSFTIKSVGRSDAGNYSCRFHDTDLRSVGSNVLQISVGEVPRAIDLIFEDFTSPELTIRCAISPYKPNEVDNKHVVYFGDDQFPILAQKDHNEVWFSHRTYSLWQLSTLSSEKQTLFSCYARNAYGKSNTISKHVDIPPYAPQKLCLHLNAKVISVGSLLNCTCLFGKPLPLVTIQLFNHSGQLVSESRDSNIIPQMAGNFTVVCQAQNFMGVVDMSWSVLVWDPSSRLMEDRKLAKKALYRHTLILTLSICASVVLVFLVLCFCRYRCNFQKCRYSSRKCLSDGQQCYIPARTSSTFFSSKLVEDAVDPGLSDELSATQLEDIVVL